MRGSGEQLVLFTGKSVVQIGLRIAFELLTAGPSGTEADPRVHKSDGFRNVTGTATEASNQKKRLTGIKRQQGFFCDAGHPPFITLYPPAEHDAGIRLSLHGLPHHCQSRSPFVLVGFMRRQSVAVFHRHPPAIFSDESKLCESLELSGECVQISSLHADMGWPCQVVDHPRVRIFLTPVACNQLEQQFCQTTKAEISAVG